MNFLGGNPHPLMIPNAFNGSARDCMGPMGKGKIANVKAYGEVLTKNVYQGIDVNSYIEKGHARFDFIVKPGADAGQARLKFNGAATELDAKGDLIAKTNVSDLKFGDLKAYQFDKGARKSVRVAFKEVDKNTYAFDLGDYDKTKELTIDPVAYGTYYGGDDGWDCVKAVVADKSGGVYLTGWTAAPSFPKIYGPYGFTLLGNQDAFITKLQGDIYSHDYAAYFGGRSQDSGDYLQIDPNGDVWVLGKTKSTDFPGNTGDNSFTSKVTQRSMNLVVSLM